MAVSAIDVMRTKRDGRRLGAEEIDWVTDVYPPGEVGDEQMSVLAMTILLHRMDSVVDRGFAGREPSDVVEPAATPAPKMLAHLSRPMWTP